MGIDISSGVFYGFSIQPASDTLLALHQLTERLAGKEVTSPNELELDLYGVIELLNEQFPTLQVEYRYDENLRQRTWNFQAKGLAVTSSDKYESVSPTLLNSFPAVSSEQMESLRTIAAAVEVNPADVLGWYFYKIVW